MNYTNHKGVAGVLHVSVLNDLNLLRGISQSQLITLQCCFIASNILVSISIATAGRIFDFRRTFSLIKFPAKYYIFLVGV